MKRSLLLTILITSCFTLQSQSDTAITFTHINTAKELNKQDIYEKIKLWSTKVFKDISGAMQLDDKESGILAFDASTHLLSPNAPNSNSILKLAAWYHKYIFKLKIQIKDGKYKLDVNEIKLINYDGDYYQLTSSTSAPYKYIFSKQSKGDKEWGDAKLTFENFCKNLFTSIDEEVAKKEDW